ncbi:MAG: hypothetical protein HN742_21095 [Lentisphaerae bacterium]|nr:hypothetical protein [Lentisphaerota bacterium]MBT5604481.1 hypothetical protein [Lentisphaerota bacterium]MBT7060482.1 hypothetical protein [Lentisphaerota bacterium]MBT7844389.1 hypothetical protein [Lentisphaerota bacterium]
MVTLCLLGAAAQGASAKVFPVPSGQEKGHRAAVRYVMGLSEEEALALIPEQSGIYFTECPNCETDAQDRAAWRWEPRKPKTLRCPGCDAVYPNPKYPTTGVLSVAAPEGEHHYPYYARDDGYRLFFEASADYKAREYMAGTAQRLGELYFLTGDDAFARRAVLILRRFAEVYPGYAYKFDYPFRPKVFVPYTQNRIKGMSTYRTSRWSWWAYMGISRELLMAYDCLQGWDGWGEVGGEKARERIEHDLFGAMVSFVMGIRETYSNMSPGMWRDFILAGRVLGREDWVAEGLTRTNHFLGTRFLYDGHWQEPAPSYCGQVLGALRNVLGAVEGYEPGAQQDAPAGTDGLSASAALGKSQESLRRSIEALGRSFYGIRLPHGGLPPVNDTWARSRQGVPAESRSLLMPGLGLAMLGGGVEKQQVSAWLNNTGGRGHKHSDALSIGLFAHGRELLRDIGYTHTAWRAWTTGTMSHNTIVVDGVNSSVASQRAENRFRCFATDGQAFHLTEAENGAVYPGKVSRFRRTLALVGEDSRDAYLIDVFQVHGGKQHDYLLHGSADEDSTADVRGVVLTPRESGLMNPGVSFKLPQGESSGVGPAGGYGFVRKLATGQASGNVVLELRLAAAPETGTRSVLVGAPGTEVFLGEAPRIRDAERHDERLPEFQAPFFCARRRGTDLTSIFVAVHEPIAGEGAVRAVTTSPLNGGTLVTVERGTHGRDYFALAFDEDASGTCPTEDGEAVFGGRWGLIRIREGTMLEGHLVGGRRFGVGKALVEGSGGWEGDVRGAMHENGEGTRGYVVVSGSVPPRVTGQVVLVTFSDGTVRAYTIGRVETSEEGQRLYTVEDPGFAMNEAGVTLTTHPHRVIAGRSVRYQIHAATHVRANTMGR